MSYEFQIARALPLQNAQGPTIETTPRADPSPATGGAKPGADMTRPQATATGGLGADRGSADLGSVNDYGLYPQRHQEVQGQLEGVSPLNGGAPVSGNVTIATAFYNVFYVNCGGDVVISVDMLPQVPASQGGDRPRSGALTIVIQPNGHSVQFSNLIAWDNGEFDLKTEGSGWAVVALQPLQGPGLPGIILGFVCGDNHQLIGG